MQILATPNLRPYIKHYLFLDISKFHNSQIRIFADGNTGIVFCSGDGALILNGLKLPKVFVYGQIEDYTTLETSGSVSLIVTVFKPYGMYGLLRMPATTVKSKIFDLEAMLGTDICNIHELICLSGSKQQKAEVLNTYFTLLMRNSETQVDPMVAGATNWILSRKGIFTAEELIDYTGYQQRTIERAFKEVVGIPPKKLGGIVRLHHFLGEVRETQRIYNITPMVYDAGYYDQAHMIREFRKIIGLTPTAYHTKYSRFAVNVIGLPDENIQS